MCKKGGEATLDSSDGGPHLCSYQEKIFRRADDDRPRSLTSGLAELIILLRK